MTYEPLTGADFFEPQGPSLGCGRHALNNFFGGVFFTTSTGGAYTEEELIQAGKNLSTAAPMDLTRVCKSLKPVGNPCPINEDYDITTLTYALVIAGYGVETLSRLPVNPSGLGYIINLDATPSKSGHWVSLRIDGSGLLFKDSLAATASYATIADFLRDKGTSFVGRYQRILAITERSAENARKVIIMAKIDTIIARLRAKINDEPALSAIRGILINLSLEQIARVYANPLHNINSGILRQYMAAVTGIHNGTNITEEAFKNYEGVRNAVIANLSQETDDSKRLMELLEKVRTSEEDTELHRLLDALDMRRTKPKLPLDLSGSPPPQTPQKPLPPRPPQNKLSNLTNFFTNQRVPEKFGPTNIVSGTFNPTINEVGPEIDFLDMHGLVTHVSDTVATVDPAAKVFYEPNGVFWARTVPDADEPWRLTQMWNWLNGTIPEKPSIGPEDKERLTKYLVLMKDVVLPRRIQKISESMPGPDQAEINEMKSYIQYLEIILNESVTSAMPLPSSGSPPSGSPLPPQKSSMSWFNPFKRK